MPSPVIDYKHCVKCIIARTHCTMNEAWEGLNTAYLSLDTSKPVPSQYWWLITIGSYNVKDAVRATYTEKDGVKRMVPSDFLTEPSPDSDEYQYDFLNAFPDGLVKEFAKRLADGESKFTVCSCQYWLRSKYKINNRKTSRSIIYDVQRMAAER